MMQKQITLQERDYKNHDKKKMLPPAVKILKSYLHYTFYTPLGGWGINENKID